MDYKTLSQAILFGIVTVLLGLILSVIFGSLKPVLPAGCEIWDEYYVMEIILFVTGFGLKYILTTDAGKMYLMN